MILQYCPIQSSLLPNTRRVTYQTLPLCILLHCSQIFPTQVLEIYLSVWELEPAILPSGCTCYKMQGDKSRKDRSDLPQSTTCIRVNVLYDKSEVECECLTCRTRHCRPCPCPTHHARTDSYICCTSKLLHINNYTLTATTKYYNLSQDVYGTGTEL